MELHVVVKPLPGFAAEDAQVLHVVGAYRDADVATAVRLLSGNEAVIRRVTVDAVAQVLLERARELGLQWPAPKPLGTAEST